MAHYKIKNITGKLGKRHVNKDTVLNIEYHVGFQKKFRKLGVNDEILLTCRTLPVSIHNLRAKQLITVSEISENEFLRLQKPSAKKQPTVIKKETVTKKEETVKDEVVEEEEPTKKTTRKKKTTTSKETSDESSED